MSLSLAKNLTEFAARARPILERDEAIYALFLGQLDRLGANGTLPAFMASTDGFAAMYHERNLIVTEGDENELEEAASALLGAKVDVPGVVGPKEAAEKFARAWSRRRRCASLLAMDQGLYRLDRVISPARPAPGAARLMTSKDLPWVEEGLRAFAAECIPHDPQPSREEAREDARRRLAAGMLYVWEDGGRLVSMASLARPTKTGITVNLVYTPASERGKGYASSVVAVTSQAGLDRGKLFCVLYTDLSNPTSNSIYQKLGYVRIGDSRNYLFKY